MKRIVSAGLVLVLLLGLSLPAFAVTRHSDLARTVLEYTNDERRAAGLEPLTWNSSLVDYANVRAEEIITHWGHTRPNGKDVTDYHGVNGENLAYGTDYTAAAVVDGWMDSPSHRENILQPRFTSMAVACVESTEYVDGYGDVPFYYWVQLFDADPSAASEKKANTTTKTTATKTAAKTETKTTAKEPLSSADVVSLLDKAKQDGTTSVVASVTNKDSISPEALKKAVDWGVSNGKGVTLVANTTFADSKNIQGQIRFTPSAFLTQKEDFALGVYVEDSKVASVKTLFEKHYSNTVAVVKMEQASSLAAPVTVVARADLSKLNTDTLYFYTYNRSANTFDPVPAPNHRIDKHGYLHLTTATNKGQYIIITDKALASK